MLQWLNSDRAGFSGFNHVMIAIMLFVALFFLPFEPFTTIVSHMRENPVTLLMCFLIICGAALLPDMDLLKSEGGSAASYDLGIIGSIISSLMVTISSIITGICRGKKDVKPNTQHRFFWHTFLIPLIIFLVTWLCVPDSDIKVMELFTASESIDKFPWHVIVILFFIFICIYTGSILLLRKLNKFSFMRISAGTIALILSLLAVIICTVFSNEGDLKFYCYCIAMGYFFHIFSDMFADGGIPAFFPITGIFGKFWMRIKLSPITVTTGSTLETLLKVVFVVIDIILIYLLFTLVLFK